ncbi:uncharacterized protein LOC143150467 [Ptiloglossa arizonensis]|uniref:uncharacterized protein LOC143150467 n=1 Tax=Ptiloglossa arizonensis TaxID=3350558 RepID=UPI003F9FFAAB
MGEPSKAKVSTTATTWKHYSYKKSKGTISTRVYLWNSGTVLRLGTLLDSCQVWKTICYDIIRKRKINILTRAESGTTRRIDLCTKKEHGSIQQTSASARCTHIGVTTTYANYTTVSSRRVFS